MSAPKAQMLKEGAVLDYTAAAAKLGGDVVKCDCGLCGVLVDDVALGLVGSAQVIGVVKVEKAQVTIVAGEDVFFDNDGNPYGGTAGSGAATNVPASGDVWMGKARAAAASTAKTVEVVLNQHEAVSPASTRTIWVDGDRQDPYTADGSEDRPYKTLEAAWAVLSATRNQINLQPGDYTTAAVLALPAYSIYVNGIGPNGCVTIAPSAAHVTAATPMFKKAAGAVAATCYFSFENITLDHGDSNIGIQIDNTTAGKKLFLSIRNVEFGGSARAIDVVTHGDTSNAVRVVINNGGMEIEGLIYFAVGNSSDYLRAENANVSGGFTSDATATVAEFTFRNCEVPHGAFSAGGASAQVLNAISCHSRDGATLAAMDGSDTGGSHTDNILTV